jgi:replicative DNA helicase
MDALTSRAEHAVLGAMVANPALCDRLRRCVKPAEFEDEWHRHVYKTVLSVSHGRPPVSDGWREAVLQADPSLTDDDLNALVSGCPDPAHGMAYGAMVVSCWARRHMADSGRALAARSRQLSREASLASRTDAGGREAAVIADHITKVARAIRTHAAAIGPWETGAGLPGRADPSPGQARREELVLAALVRQWPEQAREILQILRPEAFRDEYRREVFRVLSAMHQAARPVDELILDWELATHGLPLRSRDGGETYGQRLARLQTGYEVAVFAAHEIQDQHEPCGRPRAAGLGQAGKPRVRSAARTPRQVRGAGEMPRPVLRLVQEPGPDRGPQAR